MKNYLLLLLVFFGMNAFAGGVVVNTTITIGRKSQNCNGFGICSMEVATNQKAPGAISGRLTLDISKGFMVLSLNENDIKNSLSGCFSLFDSKTTINFEEDFFISNEINTALGSVKPQLIPKGNCSLFLKDGYYIIEIPIK